MRISCQWLSRHVDLDGVDLEALGQDLTMAFAELEEIEHPGHEFTKVIVGRVLEVQPIEGKRVQLTRTDCGEAHGGVRDIVCGASNVAAGQWVPVALPGQRFGKMEIAVAKVAGIESHGMICSLQELGLADESHGILVLEGSHLKAGQLLYEAFPEIRDTIFVIDNKSLTHRGDAWGHRGVAREVAALLGRPLKELSFDIDFQEARPFSIEVRDFALCPRYTATVVEGVEVGPSPLWLRVLLQRAGMRPINNIVDATNFVMLDLGNPLHAFDARDVRGPIVVRKAKAGEKMASLDGVERHFTEDDLLICEGEGGGVPVAIAGVMGGLNSEIKDDTTALVLEAASFDAASIRMTAQRLGLRTESSARFEKALDPRLPKDAALSFISLLKELSKDAKVSSAFMDIHQEFQPLPVIHTSEAYIEARLGVGFEKGRIQEILEGLGFMVVENAGQLKVTVPSWRATKDISIQEDLVEEIGRIFGYDHIPPAPPVVEVGLPKKNKAKVQTRLLENHLSLAMGLDQLESYSFDRESFLERLNFQPKERVALENPISSDEPFMRLALAPHLLQSLELNARAYEDMGLFEHGRVFLKEEKGLPRQPKHLSILVASSKKERPAFTHFHAGKQLLHSLAVAIERQPLELSDENVALPWLHPVRQSSLALKGKSIGYLGELHPRVLYDLGLSHQGYILELDLDAWLESESQGVSYKPLPRFPAVYRDVAVVVDEKVPARQIEEAILGADKELIAGLRFESIYRGEGLQEGKKSLAWSLVFRHPERTLKDKDVKEAEKRVWAAIQAAGGVQRGV